MKRFFLLPALAAFSLACSEHKPGAHFHTAEAQLHHHHSHGDDSGETMAEPSDASVYNLDSRWVNQAGDTLPLASLQGRVQLVALVYSSCEYACPRIMADMKRIEEAVVDTWGHRVGFVLVSIDPKTDTPQKLAAFAKKSDLNPHRWQLLHGSEGSIRELAALLGVQYKQVSETDFSHSNVITVLNPAGEIAHQQIGLGVNPDASIAAIQELLVQQLAHRSLKHH